ncbi:thermonuclease family protein [Rhizobium sp. PAMB 3174]
MAKLVSTLIGVGIGAVSSLVFLHPDTASAIASRFLPEARQSAPVPAKRPYRLCGHGKHTDCVIDGDTFYFGGEKIRIADIDAPETHPSRCQREQELGDRATERLSQLLAANDFELRPLGSRDRDRYGRKLRVVMIDGKSAGELMVEEGLARKWTGKRRPWCG